MRIDDLTHISKVVYGRELQPGDVVYTEGTVSEKVSKVVVDTVSGNKFLVPKDSYEIEEVRRDGDYLLVLGPDYYQQPLRNFSLRKRTVTFILASDVDAEKRPVDITLYIYCPEIQKVLNTSDGYFYDPDRYTNFAQGHDTLVYEFHVERINGWKVKGK